MVDGLPVGKSFEVPGADLEAATANAWRAAEAVGFNYGRSLHSEQVEAGLWEIVLAEVLPDAPGPEHVAAAFESKMRSDVDAGYEAVAADVRRARLLRFVEFLNTSTDIFDPQMVLATLGLGGSLRLRGDQAAELVDAFLSVDRDPGR